jgi:hypothetical protein
MCKKAREIMHGIEGTNVLHGLMCQWVWTKSNMNYVNRDRVKFYVERERERERGFDAIDVDSLFLYACKKLKLILYYVEGLLEVLLIMVEVLGN